jgi:hypothetical protein
MITSKKPLSYRFLILLTAVQDSLNYQFQEEYSPLIDFRQELFKLSSFIVLTSIQDLLSFQFRQEYNHLIDFHLDTFKLDIN